MRLGDGAGAFSDGKLTLSTEVGGSLEQYIGEKHLAELIDYIDRIYVNFGAPEQVYGLENEEEIEAMKRRAVLGGAQTGACPDPAYGHRQVSGCPAANV